MLVIVLNAGMAPRRFEVSRRPISLPADVLWGSLTQKDVCGEATDQSTYEDERMKAQGEGEEGE